jgi:hypothetical protein
VTFFEYGIYAPLFHIFPPAEEIACGVRPAFSRGVCGIRVLPEQRDHVGFIGRELHDIFQGLECEPAVAGRFEELHVVL